MKVGFEPTPLVETDVGSGSGSRVATDGPLSGLEPTTLLIECNQTARDYPRYRCLHQLFEEQVERVPEATAVECDGRRLTYRELNAWANLLARELRSLGVGPETLTGICVTPSEEMVAGLLGILKAGGAFVPLDPAYPRDRLGFMVKDAAISVIVTESRLKPLLADTRAQFVCLEQVRPGVRRVSPENFNGGCTLENLAYVIYTSGSTGRPKGVMVPHRGLVNYLCWAAEAYHLAEGSGAPVNSSISFDLTITPTFTPLIVGRCVHILPPEGVSSRLAETLRTRKGLSLVKITPSHLELLREQVSPECIAGATRAFVIGGEALAGESLRFWQEHAPDTQLVNEYGPTETVVGCCVYFVPQGRRVRGQVPIGRPIANTQLFVLDAQMRPVPVGVAGELYIGGHGVARGYLNQPDLTARCFVPNPFASQSLSSSPKLYKTGDLARYRPDGHLEFLGRLDDQLKIRGYRIEPGEVESALAAHPRVQSVAVTARSNGAGENQLAAYLVFRASPALSPAELRAHLAGRLPQHMIPTAFVTLNRMPLTPNGKLDRTALPLPALAGDTEFVQPRNETEHALAAVWQSVFSRPRVGVRDNFFDLGGHSLLAARLITGINRVSGVSLEIAALFENPTIEALARLVSRRGEAATRFPKLVSLTASETGMPIIFVQPPLEIRDLARLLPPQQALLASAFSFPEHVLRAAAQGKLDLLPSLPEMAEMHVRAVVEEVRPGPCLLAGFSYSGLLAFEVAHQLRRFQIPVAAMLLFDSAMKIAARDLPRMWLARLFPKTGTPGLGVLWHGARRLVHELSLRRDGSQPIAVGDLNSEVPWEIVNRIWTHAFQRYRTQSLAARGVLFRAKENFFHEKRNYDGCLGWRRYFSQGVRVLSIPGDHFSIWKEPDLISLARACSSALAELALELNGRTAF